MKKIKYLFSILVMCACMFFLSETKADAASIVDHDSYDFFGDTISTVSLYSNGNVEIEYRYGLKRVDLYYCVKGEECDNDIYSLKIILEADESNPYKNDKEGLVNYEFKIALEKGNQYRVRVEVYYATSSAYSGVEDMGAFTVTKEPLRVDSGTSYFTGSSSGSSSIKNTEMRSMVDKIKYIVNLVLIPLIYAATGLLLIVKGAILGFQIIKGADHPDVRKTKISALIWFVVGVAVAALATTIVGIITGFFKSSWFDF